MRNKTTLNAAIAMAALMFAGLSHAEKVSIDCPDPFMTMSLRWDGKAYVLAQTFGSAPTVDTRKIAKFKMFSIGKTKDNFTVSFQHESADELVTYESFHVTTANGQAYGSKGTNAHVIQSTASMWEGMLSLSSNWHRKGCTYSIQE